MNYGDVQEMMLTEHVRSVMLHGTWFDYRPDQMVTVIMDELAEVITALLRGDFHGDHGAVRELIQAAVCCTKAAMVLSDRVANDLPVIQVEEL